MQPKWLDSDFTPALTRMTWNACCLLLLPRPQPRALWSVKSEVWPGIRSFTDIPGALSRAWHQGLHTSVTHRDTQTQDHWVLLVCFSLCLILPASASCGILSMPQRSRSFTIGDPDPWWLGFRMKLLSWQPLAWLTHLVLASCTVLPPPATAPNHIRSNEKKWLACFSDLRLGASCSVWVEPLICSRKSWVAVHSSLPLVFWIFYWVMTLVQGYQSDCTWESHTEL